jgi:hypothetical protein
VRGKEVKKRLKKAYQKFGNVSFYSYVSFVIRDKDMKPPKKISQYIHFLTIIYGGRMDKNGIIECIMANSVAHANGLIGRGTFLKAEKHFVNLLKK